MRILIPTPVGEAAATVSPALGPARALLALGHGAGGGIEAADLRALAAALPERGITVALVEQPWRVAGRKVAPAPKTLDAGWLPVVDRLTTDHPLPLVVGGRSAGARVACRTAADCGAVAVLALAFPLHPPGRPERSRAGELLATDRPTLVVQGAKDPFGRPAEFPALPPTHRLLGLAQGDHSFAAPKSAPLTAEEQLARITDEAAAWLLALPPLLPGGGGPSGQR
ncbi:alpha/beta family hydrolase [Streptacidiphilus sp. P02-A3a]|uniref:alpha/beta hydrolase family protein n=1 Tax=Streptacidiphilus sp. P02-A3a TaxID=2704468 RepID=UPI0015FBEAE3|nr:alpha/beta family hydrolase [Streptacidiphilus sp. P02-A3a]QMU68100.1 hydrolase [Streptacidiphilus sp. P02-A3a]